MIRWLADRLYGIVQRHLENAWLDAHPDDAAVILAWINNPARPDDVFLEDWEVLTQPEPVRRFLAETTPL